jgi:ubiquinol-cytochrome c reductase cytochrome b subunit
LHTLAPWYFLWIQGLLKLGDKTLMGVILPTILLLAFISMPYIDVGPYRRYAKRRIAISLSLLFMVTLSVLSWMGTPAFLVQTSLDQEILFELAPTEKIGLVRAIPYTELEAVVGTALTTEDYSDTVPSGSELWNVMHEYQERVDRARETPADEGGLPNAEAFFVINQLQPELVGVTLRITWDDPGNPGQRLTNEVLVPVHEDAYPAGGGE